MQYRRLLFSLFTVSLAVGATQAQVIGEENEPTPEELDAAFSEADAAREAAAWSDVIIDRSRPDPITAMTRGADWVIRGTVDSQAYVDNEDGLPVTRTTFEVSEVLKGNDAPARFTVEQQYGISSRNPENVTMVSHAHYFTVGEEELLFIEVNPERSGHRHLVIQQRFRPFDGQVFDENGRGLLLAQEQDSENLALRVSQDRHPSPRFSEFYIGPHKLSKNFSSYEGPRDFRAGSRETEATPASYVDSVSMTDFGALIRGNGRE